jgi:hypothetical protein
MPPVLYNEQSKYPHDPRFLVPAREFRCRPEDLEIIPDQVVFPLFYGTGENRFFSCGEIIRHSQSGDLAFCYFYKLFTIVLSSGTPIKNVLQKEHQFIAGEWLPVFLKEIALLSEEQR